MVDLSNPIINSPYDPPEAHFEIGLTGPTGRLIAGRRPSESYIPIPVSRKGRQRRRKPSTSMSPASGASRTR